MTTPDAQSDTVLQSNLVPWRPPGLVVALQYWAGDEDRAMRLARVLADIEPSYRSDLVLVLVRRYDLVMSQAAAETIGYCNSKLLTFGLQAQVGPPFLCGATGHPDGANALWDGTMALLADRWRGGDLNYAFAFTIEADGCPTAPDWAIRLLREHQRSLAAGKHVTGPLMRLPFPHVNGTLILNIPWWMDHPSLRQTPSGFAWDLHHRETLVAACRPTQEIQNIYGSTQWSDAQLGPLSNEVSWLASVKDDSAIAWAEKTLVATARLTAKVDATGWACGGCGHHNPTTLAYCLKCAKVIG